MEYDFSKIEPQLVFKKFWEVSQVYPRKSGYMNEVSDYIADFGRSLGLEVIQDKYFNVIIKKPGVKGYENSPVIMLASHMDMICETKPGVKHDFMKEPLHLMIDENDNSIYAEGTTLGADNGIGMAFVMAVLESKDIPHPPIEAVFTSDEETDMNGAWNLDYRLLKSRTILSLDATRLSMGGSGELEIAMRLPRKIANQKPGNLQFSLSVGNLIGGHSGKNAFNERGNAVTLLNRMLSDLRRKYAIRIVKISGGEGMSSSLARESVCTFSVENRHKEEMIKTVHAWRETIVDELRVPDPNVRIFLREELNNSDDVTDDETTDNIINLLMILPDGIASLHKYFAKKVESCVNVGVAETYDDHFYFTALIRAAVASKKYLLLEKITKICNLMRVETEILRDLPQWDYKANSLVYDQIKHIYADMEPNVAQGTCEQGIFLKHMPNAEAAGIGPVVENPHSPNEKIKISTIQDDWSRFLLVLETLK